MHLNFVEQAVDASGANVPTSNKKSGKRGKHEDNKEEDPNESITEDIQVEATDSEVGRPTQKSFTFNNITFPSF